MRVQVSPQVLNPMTSTNSKRRSVVLLTCDNCGKVFERKAYEHKSNIKRGRTRTFCSPECAGKVRQKPAVVRTESQRIKAARDSFMEKCPNCQMRFLKVLESRLTPRGDRRRRKQCQHCDYRITTIEIPEAKADKYLNRQALKCLTCRHNFKDECQCDFGVPEYMTPDAQDCNLFSKDA